MATQTHQKMFECSDCLFQFDLHEEVQMAVIDCPNCGPDTVARPLE